jgi:hypothetical protein
LLNELENVMRALIVSAAAAALLWTAGAQAQTLDATGAASGVISQDAITIPVGPGRTLWNNNGEGGSLEALVDITASHVSFESGVAVSGGFASATSFSGVDVTLFNNTDGLVSIEQFGSTIIPAGMGFYLQDRVGLATDNNIFTGFGQTNSGLTFADLVSTDGGGLIAYSEFDFSVVSDDVTLYSLSGFMSLTYDINDGLQRNFGLTDASLALDGFTTAYDNPFAWAFAWDDTHIVLPLNALIETGQSRVIEYRTSVTSHTRAECITATTCLVAYSGFGDPIGRGGGVAFASALGGFEMASFGGGASSFDEPLENPITGIVFDPQQFVPFEFIPNGGTVPEPSTWTTVILGFGLLGAALRRRRVLTYS